LQRSSYYLVFVASLAGTTSDKALDWPASVRVLARHSRLRLPEPQAWEQEPASWALAVF